MGPRVATMPDVPPGPTTSPAAPAQETLRLNPIHPVYEIRLVTAEVRQRVELRVAPG